MKTLIKTEKNLPAAGLNDPLQSLSNRITIEFNAPGSDSIRSINSPDSRHYAFSRSDGSIIVLTRSFRQVNRIDNMDGEIWNMHRHGERVISAVTDRTVKLYRFGEGCLNYAVDTIIRTKNNSVASAFKGNTLYLLEEKTNLLRRYVFYEKNSIAVETGPLDLSCVTSHEVTKFSITGKFLVLRSAHDVELFDLKTLKRVFAVSTKEKDPYWSIGLTGNDEYIAVTDSGEVRLINFKTGHKRIVYDNTQHYPRELMSFDNMLAIGAYCRLTILRVDRDEIKNIFMENFIHNNNITAFFYDEKSRYLLSAHDELAATGPIDGVSDIYSDRIKSTAGQNAISLNVFENRRIVFGDESGVPKLIDMDSLTVRKPSALFYNFTDDWVHGVDTRGNNYYVCTCSGVRVLDAEFREINCLDFQDMRHLEIASFHGRHYITGSGIGNIRIFDFSGTRILDINTCSFKEIKNRHDEIIPFVTMYGNRIIAVTRSGKIILITISLNKGSIRASQPVIYQIPMPEETSMICTALCRNGLLYLGINGDVDTMRVYTIPGLKMKASFNLDSSCSSIDIRGNNIYCGSGSGSLYEIDGKKIRKIMKPGGMKIKEIKFTGDDRMIIACGDTTKIYRFRDKGIPDIICEVKIFPDNSVVFFHSRPDGTIIFYNPEISPLDDKNILFMKNGVILDRKRDKDEILSYMRGIYGDYAVEHGIWGRDLISDYLNLDITAKQCNTDALTQVLCLEHKKI